MANELDDRAHKHTHTLAARGLKKTTVPVRSSRA